MRVSRVSRARRVRWYHSPWLQECMLQNCATHNCHAHPSCEQGRWPRALSCRFSCSPSHCLLCASS